MTDKIDLRRLATGGPGLDTILGGGLPELSFNIIGGAPGSGQTTFAQQIMFGLASPTNKALFFTAMGEPPVKMLRYQQQFDFFDFDKIGDSVNFISLAAQVEEGNYDAFRIARAGLEIFPRILPAPEPIGAEPRMNMPAGRLSSGVPGPNTARTSANRCTAWPPCWARKA